MSNKKKNRWNNKKKTFNDNLEFTNLDKKIDFETIMDYLTSSAIFLFLFVTVIIVFTSCWFIAGGTIFKLLLPVIFVIAVDIYIYFIAKRSFKKELIPIFIGTLVFAIATIISGKIYDSTADGNTYHKLAVGAMKNGWNPVWTEVEDFNTDKGNPFDILEDNVNIKWVDTYAKGSEIYGAVVYSFTDNIESGKSFNMVFLYIAFFVLYKILRQLKLNTWKSILTSGALAFNPIILTQLSNYYLDGVLSISLFIIILTIMNRKLLKDNINYLLLGLSIIWCISVKFTGLAFAGIFCGLFYFYNNYKIIKEENKFFNKHLIKETIFYIAVVIISVLIVGSSSYTKNFLKHGHPLYPLYGKGHVDNMVVMEMPLSMQEDSRAMIFIKGIFCKSENSSPRYMPTHNEPDFKIPFTITREELTNFVSPDLRIGGFGYFFGGIFLLSIIGTIVYIYKFIKEKDYDKLISHIIVLGTITVLLLALDGGYWARYIPYVYLFPIFVIINLSIKDTNKFNKIYPLVILFFLLLDSFLILGIQVYSTRRNTIFIKENLEKLVDYSEKRGTVKIELEHHGVQGVQYNLDDLGVDYTLDEERTKIRIGYNFKY